MIYFKILHATRMASRFFAELCAMLAACFGEGEHPLKLPIGGLFADVDFALNLPTGRLRNCGGRGLGRFRAPQL